MEKTVSPLNVSPLIKVFFNAPLKSFLEFPATARWGLLLAGMMYGAARYSRLYKKEQIRLAELERTRPEREAKLKAEKEKIAKEQILDFERQLGSKL